MANVAFDDMSASSTGSRRAWCRPSFMSAIGRSRPRSAESRRASCIGRRIIATSAAANRNDVASARKDARRPNSAANPPPSAAPTASIAPQSEPKRAVAFLSSSSPRARFGTAACAAGRTKAPNAAMVAWAANASHTRPGPTASRLSAATAWTHETVTTMRRRSKRSAAAPATGETRNAGSVWETKTSDTSRLESVTSPTTPSRAT